MRKGRSLLIKMDFLRIFISCIASIAVLHTANAGCKEDTENKAEFQECKMTFIGYMAGLGGIGDASEIVKAFCSKEGQSTMACLQPYIKACGELTSDPLFAIFAIIGDNGCPPGMGGGEWGGNAECQEALGECMSMNMGGATAEDPDMENGPTIFHDFQVAIKTICGDIKGMFDCLKRKEKRCPELEDRYKEMYEMGQQQSAPGQPIPEFDDHKKFVMNECPKIPADFATNTCVKENLMKKEFTDCYKNATEQNGKRLRCDEYQAAYPCVTTALKNCGDEYKGTFTTTTNFYLAALFDDCKIAEKKKVVGLPRVADAGCAQDVGKSQGFTQCIMGYSMYMGNAASSMDPSDTTAMMTIMCSPEGKSAMKCVLDYVKTCPDLMTSGDSAPMLSSLQAFEQFGGFQQFCNSMSGPCTAVQQCLSSQNIGGDDSMTSSLSPMDAFQQMIKVICGPIKGMFECFKDVGDQCKDLENTIKGMMDMGRGQAPPGTTFPTYEETKKFAMRECPKLPADFSTNTCVKNTLKSDMFLDCYRNISVNYPNDQISCDAYRAGYKCVSMSVGKKCGAQYTKVFVKGTPMFLEGAPKNCKLESTPSGSSLVQMSSFAIFVALTLAFKLM